MDRTLTAEQLDALREFAAKHGRCWKARLREDWYGGSDIGLLRQIRNQFGPAWLTRFELPEAK